jgi:hypothetical protein
MKRSLAFFGFVAVVFAANAAPAAACSCSPEPPTLGDFDAAVTAKLVKVERVEPPDNPFNFRATHTYEIQRVWKGAGRFDLHEGDELVLKTGNEAMCGLPADEGRRYGLGLSKYRGKLTGSLCSTFTPAQMRRIAEEGHGRSGGPLCGGGAAS